MIVIIALFCRRNSGKLANQEDLQRLCRSSLLCKTRLQGKSLTSLEFRRYLWSNILFVDKSSLSGGKGINLEVRHVRNPRGQGAGE